MKIFSKNTLHFQWRLFLLLLPGFFYHIWITTNGNFIFHIDCARDILAVREIVVLHHLPLIGPTSGINGLFTGPGWYYLLSLPYVISGGDPYDSVLLMDICWLIGGYFLLLIIKNYGWAAILTAVSFWTASNYLILGSIYAFSPNPIMFLSPVFIYFLVDFVKYGKLSQALIIGLLIAIFWNLEMAFSIYLPFIFIFSLIISKRTVLLIKKEFWFGIFIPAFLGLAPQLIFEIRHNFFMLKNVLLYLTQQKSYHSTFQLGGRIAHSHDVFLEGFRGTLMNNPILYWLGVLLLVFLTGYIWRKRKIDDYLKVSFIVSVVPFVGFCIFPLVIARWHVDASLASLIIPISLAVGYLSSLKPKLGVGLTIVILAFSLNNLNFSESLNQNRSSSDPSIYKNQIAAIDYAYKAAAGQNFKAYVYSPGILDLPYQYLFWWYGQKQYGYSPLDYAYLPNEPEYVPYKNLYSKGKNPTDSGLVILIKEPGFPQREDLWKNAFTNFQLLETNKVGPLTLEVRKGRGGG